VLSRLLQHRFAVGFVVGVLVIGVPWLGTSGLLDRSSPINVGYGQIRSIHLQPVPEGPTGPLFVPQPRHADELPLALVRSFVITPLPAPLDQPHCGGGGDLIIVLKDGRQITYGPCRWPWQISELWGAMIASGEAVGCRPPDVPSDFCRALDAARHRPFRTAF
jgi:hypothetical protein